MLIQIITGLSEHDQPTVVLIQQTLSSKGYEVRLVSIEQLLRTSNSEFFEQQPMSRANITIFLSGIRWDSLSTKIHPKLLPNTIVITSNPALPSVCDIRPVAVILWDKTLAENILRAVNTLAKSPILFPARSVSYKQAEFGWIRMPILEEPVAIKAWNAFREYVWSGFKFPSWSADKGYLATTFTIVKIDQDTITVQSSTAQNLQKVPKEDFLRLAIDWKEYKSGKIPRHELRDKTRYSTYIIGILHWLDAERHLE